MAMMVSQVFKKVASGPQSGAHCFDRTGAQDPECTEGVHEGESERGAALPRPLAATGAGRRQAGPPKAGEHRASPNQGRAVVFQRPVRTQVFARAPIPGETKTRLIPHLGAEAAARLQLQLTRHAVDIARSANIGPVELWCTPDTGHPAFAEFTDNGIVLRDQGSGNIGQRMHRALCDALTTSTSAILIGSDCPALTAADLTTAASELDRGADAVFVVAEDGGYVLVGVNACSPQLFENIPWGTHSVMKHTRARLRKLGWTWREIATRWDIDRPEDYTRLLHEFPRFAVADS